MSSRRNFIPQPAIVGKSPPGDTLEAKEADLSEASASPRVRFSANRLQRKPENKSDDAGMREYKCHTHLLLYVHASSTQIFCRNPHRLRYIGHRRLEYLLLDATFCQGKLSDQNRLKSTEGCLRQHLRHEPWRSSRVQDQVKLTGEEGMEGLGTPGSGFAWPGSKQQQVLYHWQSVPCRYGLQRFALARSGTTTTIVGSALCATTET